MRNRWLERNEQKTLNERKITILFHLKFINKFLAVCAFITNLKHLSVKLFHSRFNIFNMFYKQLERNSKNSKTRKKQSLVGLTLGLQ